MRDPSQLSTPLHSQHALRIYAATNRLGGGDQLCPRARETIGMPLGLHIVVEKREVSLNFCYRLELQGLRRT